MRSLLIGACHGLVVMPGLSKDAKCVLEILHNAGSLTTVELLDLAQKDEYAALCNDCAGGDSFIVAANQLVELGLITKRFGKGGYHWQLVGD